MERERFQDAIIMKERRARSWAAVPVLAGAVAVALLFDAPLLAVLVIGAWFGEGFVRDLVTIVSLMRRKDTLKIAQEIEMSSVENKHQLAMEREKTKQMALGVERIRAETERSRDMRDAGQRGPLLDQASDPESES